jgi:hypothetical protein
VFLSLKTNKIFYFICYLKKGPTGDKGVLGDVGPTGDTGLK